MNSVCSNNQKGRYQLSIQLILRMSKSNFKLLKKNLSQSIFIRLQQLSDFSKLKLITQSKQIKKVNEKGKNLFVLC